MYIIATSSYSCMISYKRARECLGIVKPSYHLHPPLVNKTLKIYKLNERPGG